MKYVIAKSQIDAIRKNRSLVAILRKFHRRGGETLRRSEWLSKHKMQVKAAGRVLQFLGLAEPDRKSDVGWKAKPRFSNW